MGDQALGSTHSLSLHTQPGLGHTQPWGLLTPLPSIFHVWILKESTGRLQPLLTSMLPGSTGAAQALLWEPSSFSQAESTADPWEQIRGPCPPFQQCYHKALCLGFLQGGGGGKASTVPEIEKMKKEKKPKLSNTSLNKKPTKTPKSDQTLITWT